MIDFYLSLNLNVFAFFPFKFKCNLKYFNSNISCLKLLVFIFHLRSILNIITFYSLNKCSKIIYKEKKQALNLSILATL